MSKKILFLGGSIDQVPAIERAQELGYDTVLCDYNPVSPGRDKAGTFYLVSTMDQEAVLQVATAEKVDGVAAYAADSAAPAAAYAANKLGLPSYPYEAVITLTDKKKFRSFLKANDFAVPYAAGGSDVADIKEYLQSCKYPLVIKPADSSGSKGVTKVNHPDGVTEAINEAVSFSHSKTFIAEEYIAASCSQLVLDGFLVDGEIVLTFTGDQVFNLNAENPNVPIAGCYPTKVSQTLQKAFQHELERLFAALDMKNGAFVAEARVGEDGRIYLLDIGPRNGGDCIANVYQHASGTDLMTWTLLAAMGEEIPFQKRRKEITGAWCYYVIHSLEAGILDEAMAFPALEQGRVVERFDYISPGEKVSAFNGAHAKIGLLIMHFDSVEAMTDAITNHHESVRIQMQKEQPNARERSLAVPKPLRPQHIEKI